jgi:hypothetical protein
MVSLLSMAIFAGAAGVALYSLGEDIVKVINNYPPLQLPFMPTDLDAENI